MQRKPVLERRARDPYNLSEILYPVSTARQKTFDDVGTMFDDGRVLEAKPAELEQLLLALGRESSADTTRQARTAEMGRTIRQLLNAKRNEELSRQPSKLAAFAVVVALAALLSSAAQAYYFWSAHSTATRPMDKAVVSSNEPVVAEESEADPRLQTSLWDLARRAPNIRTGTLQAWWAGEQARQVLRLEAMARRQAVAGDAQGAARTVSRADAIRNTIGSLADLDKTALTDGHSPDATQRRP